VLRHALELAGHTVDARPVSLETDPCVEEEYDCAMVGIAACQGLSSRFKLGALWTLARFGKRAGIFPSDGRNIYIFPGSVLTCISGNHGARTPYEYLLHGQFETSNTVDANFAEAPEVASVLRGVLECLPHDAKQPHCDWPMLIPTHSWGNPVVYARHFGGPVSTWDPTNVAIPMQFPNLPHGDRLPFAAETGREHAWVLSTLQDQSSWVKKQKCKWPVVNIGNKRMASKGGGLAYVPELELIETYYRKYVGALVFGYPLASGGWWRMRLIHAALAGVVSCCDEKDARGMPEAFGNSRIMLERWPDEKLAQVARDQFDQITESAWSTTRAIETVEAFVKALVK
jgi:hypothetical protein